MNLACGKPLSVKHSCHTLEVCAREYPEREISYTNREGEIITYTDNPEFEDLTAEEQKRYRRGKLYYFRHFESLWD